MGRHFLMFPMDLESQTVSHKMQGSCLVEGLLSEPGSLHDSDCRSVRLGKWSLSLYSWKGPFEFSRCLGKASFLPTWREPESRGSNTGLREAVGVVLCVCPARLRAGIRDPPPAAAPPSHLPSPSLLRAHPGPLVPSTAALSSALPLATSSRTGGALPAAWPPGLPVHHQLPEPTQTHVH